MTDRSKTPACPGCGAKFSHDKDRKRCKACLLPDLVASQGEEAIALWKWQTAENKRLFGRAHARQKRDAKAKRLRKNRNKHGRVGVSRGQA